MQLNEPEGLNFVDGKKSVELLTRWLEQIPFSKVEEALVLIGGSSTDLPFVPATRVPVVDAC